MKSTKAILALIALLCLAFAPARAQVKRVQESTKKESADGDLSVRARTFYESSTPNVKDAQWTRVIYRELDLTQGANASLYYPEDPIEGQTNLFRLILGLLADGKIKAYEYLDGREIFTDKYQIQVKDVLDKFHILYEEQPARGKQQARFVIDESDVPCNEVLSYYIKERWVFDQRGSMFFSTIEAICPILHRTGDFGGDAAKYPMFWLPYEEVRPYLTQYQVMSDGLNNAPRYTFDDYFVMRRYDGKIYKTLNLQNKSLMQLYPDADSLKMAQQRIERDLTNFRDGLWVPPVETAEKADAKSAKSTLVSEDATTETDTKAERTANRSNPRAKSATTSKSKSSSSSKTSKSSGSAPVRSVRRTR
jgi:gliding motility associated protien GldN